MPKPPPMPPVERSRPEDFRLTPPPANWPPPDRDGDGVVRKPPPADWGVAFGRPPVTPLRQRSLYWRAAGEWVGFGADLNTQPDLFESVYRFAWWRVSVCRVCLVTAIRNASAIIEQAEAILSQPKRTRNEKA